jgi:hypothetical protein
LAMSSAIFSVVVLMPAARARAVKPKVPILDILSIFHSKNPLWVPKKLSVSFVNVRGGMKRPSYLSTFRPA